MLVAASVFPAETRLACATVSRRPGISVNYAADALQQSEINRTEVRVLRDMQPPV